MLIKRILTLLSFFSFLKCDLFLGVKQQSGYISVNNNLDSLFYWYFPCSNLTLDAPLVVWFQGGPGSFDFIRLFQ
jgi:carboxypeptidase C (cathepsin A)